MKYGNRFFWFEINKNYVSNRNQQNNNKDYLNAKYNKKKNGRTSHTISYLLH